MISVTSPLLQPVLEVIYVYSYSLPDNVTVEEGHLMEARGLISQSLTREMNDISKHNFPN